MSKTITTTTHR